MLGVLFFHSGWKQSPQVKMRHTHTEEKRADEVPGWRQCLQSLVFVTLVGTYNPGFRVSRVEWGSGAAEVVYDQRYIETINLQQVGKEGSISLGIQPHGPHVLTGESGVGASCYL